LSTSNTVNIQSKYFRNLYFFDELMTTTYSRIEIILKLYGLLLAEDRWPISTLLTKYNFTST